MRIDLYVLFSTLSSKYYHQATYTNLIFWLQVWAFTIPTWQVTHLLVSANSSIHYVLALIVLESITNEPFTQIFLCLQGIMENWVIENNLIYDNNLINTSPPGSFQASLIPGIGVLIIGVSGNSVLKNEIRDNSVFAVAVLGYCSAT